jgi:aspartyl-tRNA(Asn)/glutamyl-tRNA(Gln) amidotransferase subunit A
MDLHTLTLTQAKEKLTKKEISSVELTKAYLERIKTLDTKLNAFVTVTEEEALKNAEHADKLIFQGDNLPLLGIPLAIKDNFSTKGIRTTTSSKVLDNYIPPFDATVVKRLKDAGMVLLGKANMDAWAHGSSGENSDYKPTKNPWNEDFVPGGSSSGPAVSVAADLALAAMGSDTGGSIRLPASFCNVVGLKPTYGRVSRYGVVAMASSLDCMGHFTKTVGDSALLLQVTAGQDGHDATTPSKEVPNYSKDLNKDIKGLKLGIPKEYFADGLDSAIKQSLEDAIKKLEELGAEIVEVSLPNSKYANSCYYIIQPSEVSSNLARYDGIRYANDRSHFADEAKRRVMLGTHTLSTGYYDAYYKKALQVRTLIVNDFKKVWEDVDLIVAPNSPTPPWKLGEKSDDPLQMYLSDIYTITANLAGIPGISIPVGFVNDMPTGMQLLGPQFSEELLFQVGHAFQKVTDYHTLRPII